MDLQDSNMYKRLKFWRIYYSVFPTLDKRVQEDDED